MVFRASALASAGLFLAVSAAESAQVPVVRLPNGIAQKISAEGRRQRLTQRVPERSTRSKAPKSLKNWFNELVADRIDITGQRILSYHNHHVEGDREAFDTLN